MAVKGSESNTIFHNYCFGTCKFSFSTQWVLTAPQKVRRYFHLIFCISSISIIVVFSFMVLFCCSFISDIYFLLLYFKNNSVLLQVWGVVKRNKILKVPIPCCNAPSVCPIKPVVLPLWKGCSISWYREESKQNTTIQTFLNACVWVHAHLCILVSLVKVFWILKYSCWRVLT